MDFDIRPFAQDDLEAVLEVGRRAWQPVFASVNVALGDALALLLHGEDWQAHHAAEIREALASADMATWVVEADGAIVGFASARVVDPARRIGEVYIVGVDPSAQRGGVARALVREAEGWLADRGMAVIYISTGGDSGHAPARQLYSALGYRPFPVVQFYKAIDNSG